MSGDTYPRESDHVIAVMGPIGCGKSTFIHHLVQEDVAVSHSLKACTTKACMYAYKRQNDTVWLLDTPGFGSSRLGDVDVLQEIAAALIEWGTNLHLAGIIHLHPITDVRIDVSTKQSLALIQSICGGDAFGHVTLTTNRWELGEQRDMIFFQREIELKEGIWTDMMDRGSLTTRHDNTPMKAKAIIEQVLANHSKRGLFPLKIQREMLTEGKCLLETTAGRDILRGIAELESTLQCDKQDYEEEFKRALRERDDEYAAEMEKHRVEVAALLGQVEKARQDLQVRLKELLSAKRIEHARLLQLLGERRKSRSLKEGIQSSHTAGLSSSVRRPFASSNFHNFYV